MFQLPCRLSTIFGLRGGCRWGASRRPQPFTPLCERLERRFLLSVQADFNGDGFGDLAIGVPGENSSQGAVNVLYGSATGLVATNNQFWTQDSTGVLDIAEAGDAFGSALAAAR